MKYKYVLFDLDGTITDPKVGITKSVQYALAKHSIEEVSLNKLEKFIGPPLKESFIEFYSFSDEQAIKAIKYYREYFKDKGIFENRVYVGVQDLLKTLKDRDCVIAIATSKPTAFANRIIKGFDLDEYFDLVVGSNLDGTRTDKADIISYIIEELKIEKIEDVIMIGDRKHDVIGAKKNKVDSIGVLYGYGLLDELELEGPTYIVKSIRNLKELLITK